MLEMELCCDPWEEREHFCNFVLVYLSRIFLKKEDIRNVQLVSVNIPKYFWVNDGRCFKPEMPLDTIKYDFLLLSDEALSTSFSQRNGQCKEGWHSYEYIHTTTIVFHSCHSFLSVCVNSDKTMKCIEEKKKKKQIIARQEAGSTESFPGVCSTS